MAQNDQISPASPKRSRGLTAGEAKRRIDEAARGAEAARVLQEEAEQRRTHDLRTRLRLLYHGHSPWAMRFQWAVLVIDFATIAFFIASPILQGRTSFIVLDLLIAALIAADLVARALASTDFGRWLRQPTVWVDIVVLCTLLFPDYLQNLGFLRILRLWTLSRSGFLWRPLRRTELASYEDSLRAVLNLVTFLFVVTGFIYTFFAGADGKIESYIDALYFTVTTVTTTGFGDVTLPGTFGKLTSIVVMFVGISLFVRLAQAIFRPNKVRFTCPQCALQLHDADAVHCKACGHILAIPDSGTAG